MKQIQINKAYPALKRLSELSLPISKARALYKMLKQAEEIFMFAVEQERKYLEEFGGVTDSDGTVSFKDPESFGKFQEKLIELNNSETEWDIKPVILSEDDLLNQRVSSADMLRIEDFVLFE